MNHFKDEELVTIRGRVFPVIGGRLRIVHEDNQKVSIRTELLEYVLDEHAVARATVETQSGKFTGTGVATKGRDPKLVDALLELAETRAVARALRYAGIGPECCGAEEIGEGAIVAEMPAHGRDGHLKVVPTMATPTNGSRPSSNGNGSNGGRGLSVATAAQLRAIRTLARRTGTTAETVCQAQYGHGRVEGLTVKEASGLIDHLKSQAGQPAQ